MAILLETITKNKWNKDVANVLKFFKLYKKKYIENYLQSEQKELNSLSVIIASTSSYDNSFCVSR